MAAKRVRSTLTLIILLLAGLLLGSLLGRVLGDIIPFLNWGESVGFDPFTLDLGFVHATLGLRFSINIAGVIGILIAYIVYRNV